jgi:hypothetical protein
MKEPFAFETNITGIDFNSAAKRVGSESKIDEIKFCDTLMWH